MTSQRRIRARNQGLDKVRRVTMRVAGGGLVLSGGIAALASATYGGTTHHRTVTVGGVPARATTPTNPTASPLTDPTLPPTTLAPDIAGSNTTSKTVTHTPTTPATVAPLQQPQYTPQTQPPYTPPVVVSGGS
jgi:hypothetical protein